MSKSPKYLRRSIRQLLTALSVIYIILLIFAGMSIVGGTSAGVLIFLLFSVPFIGLLIRYSKTLMWFLNKFDEHNT